MGRAGLRHPPPTSQCPSPNAPHPLTRSVLSGSNASLALSPPSLNPNTYPPVGSAEAVGLQELKLAYAAGFNAAVRAGLIGCVVYAGCVVVPV